MKNARIYLSTGNRKLQGSKAVKFLIFNLPAIKTCPYATEHCKKLCYASKAERLYKGVLPCREQNLAESKKSSFVLDMYSIIFGYINKPSYKAAEKIYFRIHESGDFYSQEYFDKWVDIAKAFPVVTFLAYTKSVKYVMNTEKRIPDNLIVRFSLWDDTKPSEKGIADLLNLPTYTAEILTSDKIKALGDRYCECRDCGACGKCYGREVKDIVCKIH